MNTLKEISLTGYKSIKRLDKLEFGNLNVLVGANGSGKTNLISFFKMMNFALTGSLQTYIGRVGRANSLLHFGSSVTTTITADLVFNTPGGENGYHIRLAHAAGDMLLFTEETVTFRRPGSPTPQRVVLGAGHWESLLNDPRQREVQTVNFVRGLLTTARVYQFHNTSGSAPMRSTCNVNDNRYLFHHADNLAAVLYRLQLTSRPHYDRIVSVINQVAPFFLDFALEPDKIDTRRIELRWRERASPVEMQAHQLSDGTIRFIALATLLNLPTNELPSLIIIDEPELGLHPAAINLLAEMLRAVSENGRTQVFISTQSVRLVDHMKPEEVIVAERTDDGGTTFHRPNQDDLMAWVGEYNMGEIWEMDVIGGRPL